MKTLISIKNKLLMHKRARVVDLTLNYY
jgi:hypothetical protein